MSIQPSNESSLFLRPIVDNTVEVRRTWQHLPSSLFWSGEQLVPDRTSLTVSSFKKPLEDTFECLKSLEDMIQERKNGSSDISHHTVVQQLQLARDRLQNLLDATQTDPEFNKAYRSTLEMMFYRLARCEEAFGPYEHAHNTAALASILQRYDDLGLNVEKEELPPRTLEGYADLMAFEQKIDEEMKEYAHRQVSESSDLLGPFGITLNKCKQLLHEVSTYKAALLAELISRSSPSTQRLMRELEDLVGYVPPDQKWAFLYLAESRFTFRDVEGREKSTFDDLKEMLETARAEKEENRADMESGAYRPLSGKIALMVVSLTQNMVELVPQRILNTVSQGIQGAANLIMARTGSLFNSQPMTDSIPYALGDIRQGVGKRYHDRLEGQMKGIFARTGQEQHLIQKNYLDCTDYGFWLRNEYRHEAPLRIDWTGHFAFDCANGGRYHTTARSSMDFTPLAGWLIPDAMNEVLDFVNTVASKENVLEGRDTPTRIPTRLRPFLHNDPEFWNRFEKRALSPEDQQTYVDIRERFRAIESIAETFALSVNKQMREIIFESTSHTAPARKTQSFSTIKKIGFAIRWKFALLGAKIRDFILAPSLLSRRITRAAPPPPHAFNPAELLVPNPMTNRLREVSNTVFDLYTSIVPDIAGDIEAKKDLLKMLVKIESLALLDSFGPSRFAVIEKNREALRLKQELAAEIEAMDEEWYAEVKDTLRQLLANSERSSEHAILVAFGNSGQAVAQLAKLDEGGFALNENIQHAIRFKMMTDGAFAKSIERILSKGVPLSQEDIQVINEASFIPMIMLDALEEACNEPKLLPILDRYLSNHSFAESLNVLSSVAKSQRMQAQRAFLQECIQVLQASDAPSILIFQRTLQQLS